MKNPLIKRLHKIRLLKSEKECEEFEELAEQLHGATDTQTLGELLAVFTDETKHREVMANLQGLVETFPREVYVATLVDNLSKMVPGARNWAMTLLRTIAKTKDYLPLLRDALAKADQATKQHAKEIFEQIEKEAPSIKKVAQELIKLTSTPARKK